MKLDDFKNIEVTSLLWEPESARATVGNSAMTDTSDKLAEVIQLQTPQKFLTSGSRTYETVEFLNLAARALKRVWECKEIQVLYQSKGDINTLSDKVDRALANAKRSGFSSGELRGAESRVKKLLVEVQRRVAISSEFFELFHTVLVAIKIEVDNCKSRMFEIMEKQFSGQERSPEIELLFSELKNRIEPVKASIQFIPIRVDCFRMSAENTFPQAVVRIEQYYSDLSGAVADLASEFARFEQLMGRPSTPAVELAPVSEPPQSEAPKVSSFIPVLSLRLKGQRTEKQRFVSKLPEPTTIRTTHSTIGLRASQIPSFKVTPRSPSPVPELRERSGSLISNASTSSTLSSPATPKEPLNFETPVSHIPCIQVHAGKLSPGLQAKRPVSAILDRPLSRITKPTPVKIHPKGTNKENEESYIPVSSARKLMRPLTTISENPPSQLRNRFEGRRH